MQILIKFPDAETERRALGKLIPRFSGKSWDTGETAVPAPALGFLAEQGIQFSVIGPAPYEYVTPLRDSGAVGVQRLNPRAGSVVGRNFCRTACPFRCRIVGNTSFERSLGTGRHRLSRQSDPVFCGCARCP